MPGSSLFVSRNEFTAVGKKQYKKDNVITRSWNDTASLANFMGSRSWNRYSDPIPEAINFADTMKGIRLVETGELPFWLLGQTAWNMVAAIQNRDKAATDPNFLIQWTPGLHTELGRNVGAMRRERAAARLEAAYHDLSQMAVGSTVDLELTVPIEK
jgi:hypothetical protein